MSTVLFLVLIPTTLIIKEWVFLSGTGVLTRLETERISGINPPGSGSKQT